MKIASAKVTVMIDMQTGADKLQADAAEATLMRDMATTSAKRELLDRLKVAERLVYRKQCARRSRR